MRIVTPSNIRRGHRDAVQAFPPDLIESSQHGDINPASHVLLWVAETDANTAGVPSLYTEVVAFATGEVVEGVFHIRGQAVLPTWRGRHLQRRLCAAQLAWARRKGLKTATYARVGNAHSIANLVLSGFEPTAVTDDGFLEMECES